MSDNKQYDTRDEFCDQINNIEVLKTLNEIFAGRDEVVSANRGFRMMMTDNYLVVAHGRSGDFSTGIPYCMISTVEIKPCEHFDAIVVTEKSGVKHGFTIRREE